MNRYPMLCMHRALEIIAVTSASHFWSKFLFPTPRDVKRASSVTSSSSSIECEEFFNPLIAQNEEQKLAVNLNFEYLRVSWHRRWYCNQFWNEIFFFRYWKIYSWVCKLKRLLLFELCFDLFTSRIIHKIVKLLLHTPFHTGSVKRHASNKN